MWWLFTLHNYRGSWAGQVGEPGVIAMVRSMPFHWKGRGGFKSSKRRGKGARGKSRGVFGLGLESGRLCTSIRGKGLGAPKEDSCWFRAKVQLIQPSVSFFPASQKQSGSLHEGPERQQPSLDVCPRYLISGDTLLLCMEGPFGKVTLSF